MKDTMTAKEYREYIEGKTQPSKNKFGAKKVVTETQTFDSIGEKHRHDHLMLLKKAGCITGLCTQVSFDLQGVKYVADFVYYDIENQKWIVEDFKGHKTQAYRNKKKLMKTLLGIDVLETKSKQAHGRKR